MSNEKKDAMIASIENVEAIKEFLNEWYSVSDLFETAANAGSVLLELVNVHAISQDDLKHITRLIDQHVMVANLLKRFEHGEERAETGGRSDS